MINYKFRGRKTVSKEWVYGNLVKDTKDNSYIVPFDNFYPDGHHLVYDDESDSPMFFDQETIGMFFKRDILGNDIYEGDLVQYKDSKDPACAVEFENGHFTCGQYNPNLPLLIVGNIFTNK